MSDISNSIRLNDHMSSTLRTINTSMEQTISIMQRLDRQLRCKRLVLEAAAWAAWIPVSARLWPEYGC